MVYIGITIVDKTIHFLCGIPRSGNTLLSSILNQNPNVYSSPLSSLYVNLENLYENLYSQNSLRNYENKNRNENILKQCAELFYSDVENKIIFDREKVWTTPYYFNLIKLFITENPKIIMTVRSMPEALSSFIKIKKDVINKEMLMYNFKTDGYEKKEDAMCNFLLQEGGIFYKTLIGLENAVKPENKNNILFIEFNDIIQNPESVTNSIYDFIGIERFSHNFINIKKIEVDNDENAGDPDNMHSVLPFLDKTKINQKSILSETFTKECLKYNIC
jgi:sulfotransferase